MTLNQLSAFQQSSTVADGQIFSPTQHVLHLLDNHPPR